MKNSSLKILNILIVLSSVFIGCSDDDYGVLYSDNLHAAYGAFDTNETDIYLSDDEKTVTIETTGNPNHETVYWSDSNPLFRYESGVATTPSVIDGFDGSDVLRVSASPSIASYTTATELNTIGISVSGAAIFNDEEGNGALDEAAASLDWTGGHIGPGVYHYHLEPVAFSDDDENLIGVLKDGFFIYGRKCNSTGTYPKDLDNSGGHISTTQHTNEEEYHYHVINELYSTTGSYIVFAGPYKGNI